MSSFQEKQPAPKLPTKIKILLDGDPLDNPIPRKRKSGDGIKDKGPPPAAKMKFSLGSKLTKGRLKISLNKPQTNSIDKNKTKPVTSGAVAAAFNADEESEEEEMPLEARMKMRNVGKDTPVPSGPYSFGKSRLGFSEDYKMYERRLMEQIGDPDKPKDKKSDTKPS